MNKIPLDEQLEYLRQSSPDRYSDDPLFSLSRITLSGYLEGAALAMGSPYPLWLLAKITGCQWGKGQGSFHPAVSMKAVLTWLRNTCREDSDFGRQAGQLLFLLLCEIPYCVQNNKKEDVI